MATIRTLLLLSIIGLTSCVGDDFIDDFVQPELRVNAVPETIMLGEAHALQVTFLNNVGQPTEQPIEYGSSETTVLSISDIGIITTHAVGSSDVTISTEYEGELLQQSYTIAVTTEATEPTELATKSGQISTTSSYRLTGGFEIAETASGISINIAEDYVASRALPGLYVYLTNNRNTTVGALEIGKVQVFEGMHSYDIEGVSINDFSHILYFCKPFGVKVGDGAIQ